MPDGFDQEGLCKLCRMTRTPEGHDPCIANLPNVKFACCGHGVKQGYISWEDGRAIYFEPHDMYITPYNVTYEKTDKEPVLIDGKPHYSHAAIRVPKEGHSVVTFPKLRGMAAARPVKTGIHNRSRNGTWQVLLPDEEEQDADL